MASLRQMLCAGGLSLALMEVHAQSAALRHSAAGGVHQILIKAPPPTKHSIEEEIAPICADGFNKAYQKCFTSGDKRYMMHIYTAAGKAYCGYQGGYAVPDSYADHTACFASPGQSEALFYDQKYKALMTFEGQVAVPGVSVYWKNALNCQNEFGPNGPCSANVPVRFRRKIVINQKSEEMIPGQDRHLAWDRSVGYVGINTMYPGDTHMENKAVYIKNLVGGDALVTDVPCNKVGSVTDQTTNFPIKGTVSGCRNENGDYYMLMGRQVTVCFPGASC